MTAAVSRPAIPEDVKRQVRQRCYFGCVICGMPIFDYDHIVEYAEVREHSAENLTLLCPNHHRAKTNKHLDLATLSERSATPFNKGRKFTGSYGFEVSRTLTLEFGTNRHLTNHIKNGESKDAIRVNGRPYLSFVKEADWLAFSAIVTDDRGRELLKIVRGEMVASTEQWDITYTGSNLMVRSGKGQIILDVELTNTSLNVRRGAFIDARDRTGFLASPRGLQNMIGGQLFGMSSNCTVANAGGAGWAISNADTPQWNVLAFERRP